MTISPKVLGIEIQNIYGNNKSEKNNSHEHQQNIEFLLVKWNGGEDNEDEGILIKFQQKNIS